MALIVKSYDINMDDEKNELLGKIAIIQLVQRVIHKVTGYL